MSNPNTITRFIWSFQRHFRISEELAAEYLLPRLDSRFSPEVFLVAIRDKEGASPFMACVEPEQEFWAESGNENRARSNYALNASVTSTGLPSPRTIWALDTALKRSKDKLDNPLHFGQRDGKGDAAPRSLFFHPISHLADPVHAILEDTFRTP